MSDAAASLRLPVVPRSQLDVRPRRRTLISLERVRGLLAYDADTGEFTWQESRGPAKKGAAAGTRRRDGYRSIMIDGEQILAHRLAWFYVHGVWPAATIDHRDGCKSNDAIANLREATFQQNNCNKPAGPSSSGLKGVGWHRCSKRWQARIKAFGKTKYLGLFDTPEEAHAAYRIAAERIHGQFARA